MLGKHFHLKYNSSVFGEKGGGSETSKGDKKRFLGLFVPRNSATTYNNSRGIVFNNKTKFVETLVLVVVLKEHY